MICTKRSVSPIASYCSGRVIRVDKVAMSRPRDVFRMHDDSRFRALYDAIWVELERQVREQRTDAA